MEQFARVVEEELTDCGFVFTVYLKNGTASDTLIRALDEAHANDIARAINEGAGWVES